LIAEQPVIADDGGEVVVRRKFANCLYGARVGRCVLDVVTTLLKHAFQLKAFQKLILDDEYGTHNNIQRLRAILSTREEQFDAECLLAVHPKTPINAREFLV
jgi:hypothetical protein